MDGFQHREYQAHFAVKIEDFEGLLEFVGVIFTHLA
jgi:hypothetical protein